MLKRTRAVCSKPLIFKRMSDESQDAGPGSPEKSLYLVFKAEKERFGEEGMFNQRAPPLHASPVSLPPSWYTVLLSLGTAKTLLGTAPARPFATSRNILNGDDRAKGFPQSHALVSIGSYNEAAPCFSQGLPDSRPPKGRQALVKMRDTIGTVAVTEYKSMTERQLPTSGIGAQVNPWTFAGVRMPIVSHHRAETADRNEIFHGTLLG